MCPGCSVPRNIYELYIYDGKFAKTRNFDKNDMHRLVKMIYAESFLSNYNRECSSLNHNYAIALIVIKISSFLWMSNRNSNLSKFHCNHTLLEQFWVLLSQVKKYEYPLQGNSESTTLVNSESIQIAHKVKYRKNTWTSVPK